MKSKRSENARRRSVQGSPPSAPLVLLPALALPACTLLEEPFEPRRVSGDAGALDAVDESSTPANDEATAPGCVVNDPEGLRFDSDDPSCLGPVGLLPAAADGGDGALVEPVPPMSPPPCDGEWGDFEAVERVTGLEQFDENVFGPALSADGRTLYFSAYASGEQQIYMATRSARGAAFEDVTELRGVNSPASDGSPFLSADGERLYLFSERDGVGGRDLWLSWRQDQAATFSEPQLLPGINSRETDLLPWLSPDELTLIFVSSRAGGRGGTDLWRATRDDIGDDFGDAVNLAELSSDQNEGRAVLSADGLTAFFTSDRGGGRGAPDIWTATRASLQEPFSPPRNVWWLNSGANDQDVTLSSDETELFFASSRRGVSELWRTVRRCS